MIKKILLVMLGISTVMSNVCTVQAQEREIVQNKLETQQWEYSITPIDEKWSKLASYQAMVDACQLSQEYLKQAPTRELLETVSKYPLILDILNYDDIKKGVAAVSKQFNGLEELLNRKDVNEIVREEYKKVKIPIAERCDYASMSIQNIAFLKDKLNREKVYYDMQDELKSVLYEGILLQDTVSAKYSMNDKKKILQDAIHKMLEREKSSVYNYSRESYFIEEVYKDCKEEWWQALKEVASMDSLWNLSDTISNIGIKEGAYKEKYLKNYRKSDSNIYVKTPNGTKVVCIVKSDNHINSNKIVERTRTTYPKVTIVAAGYSGNNCHAYAWTGRQDIWMNSPASYISDGSYKKINRPTQNGQKVVWGNFSHSGIVTDYNKESPIITSKLAGGCIVKAAAKDVPATGSIVYYKRNN